MSIYKTLSVIKRIFSAKWCSKIKSLSLSLKYGKGGIILVAPKTSIRISRKSRINVKGILEINKPWENKQIFPAIFYVNDNAEVSVAGKFSFFSGCNITINNGAHLSLNNGFMNERGVIACFENIEIGNETIIANDVIIRDSDNHTIIKDNYKKCAPIRIGDHVWIGMRSMILKGTSLGNNCVVAAGAVVNKNIPSGVLTGGVPCRIIREGVEWTR